MKANPRTIVVFVLFVLLALGIHLTYLFQASQSPIGRFVILDSEIYQGRALEILRGQVLPREAFRMSPAYPYILSAEYWMSGTENPNAARLWQAFMGAIGCGLTFLLGRRLFGSRAGVLAGVLYLLCGPLVFTEGLILAESSLCFIHLIFVLMLIAAIRRDSAVMAALAGVTLGLCAALRGNVLLYMIPLGVFFLLRPRGGRKQLALSVGLPLLLGVVAPVALITAANYHAEKDFVLLSSNAGFNFYIGNHAKSSGAFDKIEGHDESRGFDPLKDPDGRDFARSIVGRHLTPSEASRFWFRSTLDSARGRWGDFVLRLLKKGLLFFSARDIPQIYSYDVARAESPVLRLLCISFAVLTPLGLFGLGLAFRKGEEHRLIGILSICYVVSIALFFVVSRYRITIMPIFLALSGGASCYVVDAIWNRAWPRVAKAAVAIVLLAFLPIAALEPFEERTVFAHFAQEYASVGQLKAARFVAEKGLERYPDDGPLLYLVGELELADGDREGAGRDFRRAAYSTDPQAKYFFSLARLLTAEERLDEALQTVTAALKMWPENVEGLVLMAELQRQKGDIEGATKTLLEAEQLAPTADRQSPTANAVLKPVQ